MCSYIYSYGLSLVSHSMVTLFLRLHYDEEGIALNKTPQEVYVEAAGCKKPKSRFNMEFDQLSLHLDLCLKHDSKDWTSKIMCKVQEQFFTRAIGANKKDKDGSVFV